MDNNIFKKIFMRVSAVDSSAFKESALDNQYKGKLAFVEDTDVSAYELYVDGRKVTANEVYVGDPSDAPSDAKIIIDNTTNDAVTVYTKAEVDEKLRDHTVFKVEMTETTAELSPNTFYVWGKVDELDITLATPEDDTIYNEYMFQFTSGDTATTLSLPDGIIWYSGNNTISANKTYRITIVGNLAVLESFGSADEPAYEQLTFIDAYGAETDINVLTKS